jgi:hypothetical protein
MEDSSDASSDATDNAGTFGMLLDMLHGNNSISTIRPKGVVSAPSTRKNAAAMTVLEQNAGSKAYDGAALSFSAPFLIDKLLKTGLFSTAEEAEATFTELKKYLIIVSSNRKKVWSIYSVRIDSVWHEFILFTEAYAEYCKNYFGFYIHHSPSNAPQIDGLSPKPIESWDRFCAEYVQMFGSSPPSLWNDAQGLTQSHRVINEATNELMVRRVGPEVELIGPRQCPILTVNDLAYDAMEFICHTRSFYVRELPGDLSDSEKIGLVTVLMRSNLLRLAS